MNFILQAAAAVDTTGVAGAANEVEFKLIDILVKGGVVMIPLLLLSLVSIAYIIERYMYIRDRSKMDPNLVKNVLDKVYNGQLDSAGLLCEQSNSGLGNVIKAGIDNLGKPIEHVEKALTAQSNIELSAMESKMGYISIISGIAPRIGFIGTIIGVIMIFAEIAQNADVSISNISAGLNTKMITSATGLIVGAIAFLGYNYLLTRVDNFSFKLQKEVLEFIKGLDKPA